MGLLLAAGQVVARADVDTGGGEMLVNLAPLPEAIATETYPPNIPGFDVETLGERLREIDAHIRESGSFAVQSHRCMVRATKS